MQLVPRLLGHSGGRWSDDYERLVRETLLEPDGRDTIELA